MDCPICSSNMMVKTVEDVEIDICPNCEGIWLDGGELQALAGLDPKISRIISCAKCSTEMQLKMVRGVEIDLCPNCGSVYLDKDELEKLSGIDPKTGQRSALGEFLNREFQALLKERMTN